LLLPRTSGEKSMAKIEVRPIGRTGLTTSLIGFGALEIGRDWGVGNASERTRPSEDDAGKTLHAVLDLGITLIDTASAYHRSEQRAPIDQLLAIIYALLGLAVIIAVLGIVNTLACR
jgi:predicted aldo/keto reductase-like oxidoreductase